MVDATGKWPGIFQRLGIDVGNGKHCPCPSCGGRDRFRFDDKDGSGSWICNQCGAGNGWALIMRVYKCSFDEALAMVKPIIGDIPKRKRRRKLTDKKKALNQLWQSSKPLQAGDPVMTYLNSRGITMIPQSIRYCPSCYEAETKTQMPAMVARVISPDNKPVTLHRTYLNGTGKAEIESPRKIMPHDGNMTGSAVRLCAAEAKMGIAEGIETAMSAAKLFGIPVWAALTAVLMEQWEPPAVAKEIIVLGDCDLSFAGQKSAYVLANKLAVRGVAVTVELPDIPGDFNDVLRGSK